MKKMKKINFVLILIIITVIVPSVELFCFNGYVAYKDWCFKIFKKERYSTAVTKCRNDFAHLITTTDNDVMNYLHTAFGDTQIGV
jgi:hypothetical protein